MAKNSKYSHQSDSDSEDIDITKNLLGLTQDGSDSSDESDNSYNSELQDEILSDEEKPSNTNKEQDFSFPLLELTNPNDATQTDKKTSNESDESDNEYFENLTSNELATKNKKILKGFAALGFKSTTLLKNVSKKGFKQPTPIQRKTIPLILQKKDVVAMARTGSGKTAAFILPLIERLKQHSAKIGVRAIILSPSRELALQTWKIFKEFTKNMNLRSVLLTGGDSLEEQFSMMMNNPDVVIATPGRFLHLKVEMQLDLKTVEYICFDEADRLFEMGFAEQLNELLASLPMQRQTLLFSATLPGSLVEFAKAGLVNPVLVRLDTETKISENLETLFVSIKNDEREANLLYLLQEVIKLDMATSEQIVKYAKVMKRSDEDGDNDEKPTTFRKKKEALDLRVAKANELPSEKATIIFVPTKHHVEYISQLLRDAGYLISYIYGSLDQFARRQQLFNFRCGLTSLLVVTDVAARGIDIPILANVINYSLPASSKIFVHRVGRTARAGNKGWAYTLVSENELPYLLDLEIFLGKKILLTSMYERGCEILKNKWIEQGNSEHEFKEPTVSYVNRLVLGSCPRLGLEDMGDLYKNLMSNNYELETLKGVALKAQKLYMRTKQQSSAESIKRTKEIMLAGWDEQNLIFGKNEEKEKLAFLAKLQNRQNKQSVFEFARAQDDEMAIFMQKRRKQIMPIQAKSKERRELLEKERLAGLRNSVEDEIFKNQEVNDNEFKDLASGYTVPDEVLNQFKDGDEALAELKEETSNKQRQKKTKPSTFKDPQFFMSHYAAASDIQEKQLSIQSNFSTDAAKAGFDLSSDDKVQVHKQTAKMVWDKKRKKYVNSQGVDNKKYIIGESGQKIPASFRSGRFDEWSKARKVGPIKVGTKENENTSTFLANPTANNTNDVIQSKLSGRHMGGDGKMNGKFMHKQNKAPKIADKYRDDFDSQKKRVKQALEEGKHVKGVQRKGGNAQGLRSTEDIRKRRLEQEKRREKNARPAKRRKH
ncbi:probable ATP-dependent RNA helicase DBP10 [Hanseniaspora guilliermondii]|uniref:ATP-dependent RNA helicase DBP10 n=1 Tax=Hanseniaspora guilliermondii TaxID=56406 RepID=A0A1L0FL43_9ASCO|nr:probable ATP-dependent RNA helicase DBP10 [Hanseniaspora guilliermondii]